MGIKSDIKCLACRCCMNVSPVKLEELSFPIDGEKGQLPQKCVHNVEDRHARVISIISSEEEASRGVGWAVTIGGTEASACI